MKKMIVSLVAVSLSGIAVGQGTVDFSNSGAFRTSDDRLVYLGQVGGEKLVGTNYAAALFYTLPDTADLILVPGAIRLFREPITTLPGTWNTDPSRMVTLPGVSVLQTTTLQVRVWDAQEFESWEAAIAAGGAHGESIPFLYTVPNVGPPAEFWKMNNLRAFAVIPEPATFALCILGMGAWWIARRAKQRRTSMTAATFSLLAVGMVDTAVAQGTVEFRNSGTFPTEADRSVYLNEVGREKLVGTNYAAALYYTLPGSTDMLPVPGAIRLFRAPPTTIPGTWNTQPTPTVTLPGVPIGSITTLQVRVWEIQQFDTWEAAILGGGPHGESNPFSYVPPPVGPPASEWTLKGLRAFAVIPEPATFALCLLGMGVWWIAWRAK